MNAITDSYTLANGTKIPCLGFGTWQTPDGDIAVQSVLAALKAGYRHIDTAAAYGNEASVGRAVKASGFPRHEIFITSKLANPDHGYAATLAAFDRTLRNLGTDYLDLYLIHWPNPLPFRACWQETNAGSWRAMEELNRSGRIRAIGVSNFFPRHLDVLLETARISPMVNQILLCPGETQDATVSYCRSQGILLEAYSPLGTGKVFTLPLLQDLSRKYKKTVAQVCLRWSLQMGFLPLPKSVTASRIQENTDVFDFELEMDDVARISGVTDFVKRQLDPDTADF